MLKIGGADMPAPTELIWSISDLDSTKSGRTADGKMHRDRIRSVIKLNLKWSFLTEAEMSKLLKAVSGISFTCTYPDPSTGAAATATFYVGDRSAPVYGVYNGRVGWQGVEMNFIEL